MYPSLAVLSDWGTHITIAVVWLLFVVALLRVLSMQRRRPIRKLGRRALREMDALRAFSSNPPSRCERCGRFTRVYAHHRLPRSRGGKHTPENRAWLCWNCHREVHDRIAPDWRKWID